MMSAGASCVVIEVRHFTKYSGLVPRVGTTIRTLGSGTS